MLRQPTVLVLGAGASAPYAFPIGTTLVDNILTESDEIKSRVSGHLFAAEHVDAFMSTLREARPLSIDSFLETSRDFLDVGKAAIADVLLRREANSWVDGGAGSGDWYRYLFHQFLLRKDRDTFLAQARNLEVITFNFDRSFEWTLFRRVRAQFRTSDEEARLLTTAIRVHHINGSLGEPIWLSSSHQGIDYGTTDLPGALHRAWKSIQIVHDRRDSDAVIGYAQAALKRARYVYFIGFGFDDRNLQSLGTPATIRHSNNQATAFEVTPLELNPTRAHFASTNDSPGNSVVFHSEDALTFCRNHAAAFFD